MYLVSIIIPVYNGANFIQEAIESALAQTYENIEVLVVDDGSKDNTSEICDSYKGKIRYFYKQNGGVASAVNYGIQRACGDYISWLSHDDTYHPDKIKSQIDALIKSNSPTAIVHGNFNVVNEIYHTTTLVENDRTYGLERMENSVMPLLLVAFHGCVPLIHKSHFDRVGMFDESLPLTQDYDFFFRAMRGQKTVFVRKALVNVRIHAESGRNTAQKFERACAEQYMEFAKKLSYSEVKQLFGEPSIFYYRTAAMIAARGFGDAAVDFLKNTDYANSSPYDFEKFLFENIGFSKKKIIIFGNGLQGKLLYYELMGRGITAFAFLDNNCEKQGSVWQGVLCASMNELKKYSEESVVIVSPEDSDGIVAQLEEQGFTNVVTKKELEKLFLKYPPFDKEVLWYEMDRQRA